MQTGQKRQFFPDIAHVQIEFGDKPYEADHQRQPDQQDLPLKFAGHDGVAVQMRNPFKWNQKDASLAKCVTKCSLVSRNKGENSPLLKVFMA